MQRSKTNIDIILENRGKLNLYANNHIASGGEGSVYKASNTAIKIYHNPQKVIWNNIEEKINFFSSNPNDSVVSPIGKVLSCNDNN